MKKTRVWLVAVVWVVVGLLLGYIIGASGLLPALPPNTFNSPKENTSQVENAINRNYIGQWKFKNGDYTTLLTIREDGSVTEDEYVVDDVKETKSGTLKNDAIAYTRKITYKFNGYSGYTDTVETDTEITEYYQITISDDDVLDVLIGRNGAAGTRRFFRVTE